HPSIDRSSDPTEVREQPSPLPLFLLRFEIHGGASAVRHLKPSPVVLFVCSRRADLKARPADLLPPTSSLVSTRIEGLAITSLA
ncbi:Os05g0436400, partial [Oryza sativa Japonica Group]